MSIDLGKAIEKGIRGLRKIQRADDRTKKQYLVIFSSLAMILVVGLWFFYLSISLPQPPDTASKEVPDIVAKKENNSFFKIFSRGLQKIAGDLKEQFIKIRDGLVQAFVILNREASRVNEFTLEREDKDFILENEPLPPTPLP